MNPTTKKLICFDLDGTLLNGRKQISARNADLIRRLTQAGHVVSIATGRLYKSACKVRHLIPAPVEIICSNGAVIETGGKIIRRDQIPPKDLEVLYHLTKEHDLSLAFVSLYAVYHTTLGWTFRMSYFSNVMNKGHLKIRNVHVRNLKEYLRYAPYYINGIVISKTRPERIASLRRELEALDLYNIESSSPDNVEIIPRHSNKGTAALVLAKRHGIAPEDVIAFGDGENDLKMLGQAGLGIAMGNATFDLKQTADLVIGDNNSDAIARTLDQLLGLAP